MPEPRTEPRSQEEAQIPGWILDPGSQDGSRILEGSPDPGMDAGTDPGSQEEAQIPGQSPDPRRKPGSQDGARIPGRIPDPRTEPGSQEEARIPRWIPDPGRIPGQIPGGSLDPGMEPGSREEARILGRSPDPRRKPGSQDGARIPGRSPDPGMEPGSQDGARTGTTQPSLSTCSPLEFRCDVSHRCVCCCASLLWLLGAFLDSLSLSLSAFTSHLCCHVITLPSSCSSVVTLPSTHRQPPPTRCHPPACLFSQVFGSGSRSDSPWTRRGF